MTENDIQADYRRKVAAAEKEAANLLANRLAQLKTERNQAISGLAKGGSDLGNASVQGSEDSPASSEDSPPGSADSPTSIQKTEKPKRKAALAQK